MLSIGLDDDNNVQIAKISSEELPGESLNTCLHLDRLLSEINIVSITQTYSQNITCQNTTEFV